MGAVLSSDAFFGLTLIFAAAVLAPLLSDRLGRWLPVPSTVLEIMLGILLGPSVFALVQQNVFTDRFHDLGLAMLFFLAGYEIEFGRIKGRPLMLGGIGWLIGIILALGVSTAVTRSLDVGLIIGVAVCTTALGTILPMIRDAGILPTRVGAHIMAIGAVGEFAPMIAITILFGRTGESHSPWVRAGFVVLAIVAAWAAMRPRSERVGRLLSATLGTSVQFAVRLAMLMVVMMIWISYELGLDIVLGGFVAGVVIRLLISTIEKEEAEIVASKLDAVGFGFLVPFFFVTTGVGYDLKALLDSPSALLALPAILVMFLLVRGVITYWILRKDFTVGERRKLALLSSTQLPLVVVVAGIGVSTGRISVATESALVGAAMLSVLIFPLLAIRPGSAAQATARDHVVNEPT
ncbi:cation:proton antiporter [Phytomonospora sp. NPDC050363]|uniref:cation:proton antiporter n=1 Tax=Phytomonospora sp. NPDC050363 TaxID=3155642 RepID=UPI0033CB5C21